MGPRGSRLQPVVTADGSDFTGSGSFARTVG